MESLNSILPKEWSRNNPIDILGDATPERYAKPSKWSPKTRTRTDCSRSSPRSR